jgi:hypothetical protein
MTDPIAIRNATRLGLALGVIVVAVAIGLGLRSAPSCRTYALIETNRGVDALCLDGSSVERVTGDWCIKTGKLERNACK